MLRTPLARLTPHSFLRHALRLVRFVMLWGLVLAGTAAIAQPFPGFSQARSFTLGDGKRLLLGTVAHPVDPVFYDFAIARMNGDGNPDLTFGGGTGLAVLPVWGDYEFAPARAVEFDGRI